MKIILTVFSVFTFFFIQVNSQPKYGPDDWYTDYKGVVKIISNNYNGSCKGALIHSEWVLTSAVCAIRTFHQEMRILFGGDDYFFDSGAHIKNTYIHPEFDGEIREHDIALLELAKPADESIRIFKIPRLNRTLVAKKAKFIKWSYYPSGWGTAPPSTIDPNVDNESTFAPASDTRTANEVPGYNFYDQVVILNNELCANYPVHVSENRLCSYQSIVCEGDEGAPLVSWKENELVGLASVSAVQAAICYNSCIIPVSTFTSVVPYRHWIRSVTELNIL